MAGQPMLFKRRPVWPLFIFVADQSRSGRYEYNWQRQKRRSKSPYWVSPPKPESTPPNTNRQTDRPVKFVNLLKFKKIFDKYIMPTKQIVDALYFQGARR